MIGIVVVTWNSEHVIDACLDSCARWAPEAPVVVVDNASWDGTVSRAGARPVTVLRNSRNAGFAAAANQGIRALASDLVLLLNPDCRLEASLEPLAAATGDEVAAATGRMYDSGGQLQQGFFARRLPGAWTLAFETLGLNRVLPWNPVNRRYRCLNLDAERPSDIEQPAGAFLMLRRQIWETVGGFDESFYPLWFEDVDFCRRLKDAGWRIRYVPQAVVRHRGAHSVAQLPVECRGLYWYGSLLRYAAKHCSRAGQCLVALAVVVGSSFRVVMGMLSERKLSVVSNSGKVIRFAGRVLTSGRLDRRDEEHAPVSQPSRT
ncbi:MAG TPA: glycosyltransferase family 2 protein [Terriglobales bacterium]